MIPIDANVFCVYAHYTYFFPVEEKGHWLFAIDQKQAQKNKKSADKTRQKASSDELWQVFFGGGKSLKSQLCLETVSEHIVLRANCMFPDTFWVRKTVLRKISGWHLRADTSELHIMNHLPVSQILSSLRRSHPRLCCFYSHRRSFDFKLLPLLVREPGLCPLNEPQYKVEQDIDPWPGQKINRTLLVFPYQTRWQTASSLWKKYCSLHTQ